PGWLQQYEGLAVGEQRPPDEHLLLVASAEVDNPLSRSGHLDIKQRADALEAAHLLLSPDEQPPQCRDRPNDYNREVMEHRHCRQEARVLAVLGDIPDPELDRVAGTINRHFAALE